ncbi:MAG: flagellar hook-length control protein FliK [Desulfohalobiaceae bacterium]|nr:flagellar hook-length control protein FliK [Desulfohalobiaceae bacterium]
MPITTKQEPRDSLDLILAELKTDDRDHFSGDLGKIDSLRLELLQFLGADKNGLTSGQEAAVRQELLFLARDVNSVEEPLGLEALQGANKAETNGLEIFPATAGKENLRGRLMRLLESFDAGQSRIQSGGFGSQTGGLSEAWTDRGQELSRFLERMQQILESSSGPAREARGVANGFSEEIAEAGTQLSSWPEMDPGHKHQALLERMQRIFESQGAARENRAAADELAAKAVASVFPGGTNPGHKHPVLLKQMQQALESARVSVRLEEAPQPAEAGVDPRLRQLLNALAAESKNSLEAGLEKKDIVLAGYQDQQGKMKNINQLMQSIHSATGQADSQIKYPGNQPESDSIVQFQPPSGGSGKPDSPVLQVRPDSATSFDKNLQTMENKVVGQVFVRLFSGLRQGSGSMTINMHPPELGKVKIRLISDKSGLNVHLHSQNQQVAGVLEKHLPTLQQSLQDQGISLSGLQVGVDSGEQDKPGFEDQGFLETAGKKGHPGPVEEDDSPGISDQYQAWSGQSQGLSLRV